MDDIAIIVTATLDEQKGESVCQEAVAMAGVPASYIVEVDKRKEGGCKTANRGWRYGFSLGAPYICYVNDDVRFLQDWLKVLIDALGQDPKYGVAAPGGRCRAGKQAKAKPGMPYGVVPVQTLSFFCVAIRRAVMEQIGFLDERFIHYGCDSDYVLRVLESGWKCVWVRHLWLAHEMGEKVKEWQEKDKAQFERKWGR